MSVSTTAGSVPEGGTNTYEVALDSAPTAEVVVSLTVPAGELSAAPATLAFSAANWAVAQTVTLSATADQDAAADAAVTITHAVAGGDYGDVAGRGLGGDDRRAGHADAVRRRAPRPWPRNGGTARFAFTLDRRSGAAVTASYTTVDGTATAPDDYEVRRGTGAVPGRRDRADHHRAGGRRRRGRGRSGETFALLLSDPEGLDFAAAAATVTVTRTIVDNDEPTLEVAFRQAVYAVAGRAEADGDRGGQHGPRAARGGAPRARAGVRRGRRRLFRGAGVADLRGRATRRAHSPCRRRTTPWTDDGETVALSFGRLPSGVSAGDASTASGPLGRQRRPRGVALSPTELLVTEGSSKSYRGDAGQPADGRGSRSRSTSRPMPASTSHRRW